MNKEFNKALQQVLKWEGFISADPNDKGGLTIWGISLRSYPIAVPKMKELIDAGKKNEALAIAKKIYYKNYWLKMECDRYNSPMDIVLFDTAVNMGRSRAKEILKATNLAGGEWEHYLLQRLYTYSKFRQAKLYFRGWANRVLDLYKMIERKKEC